MPARSRASSRRFFRVPESQREHAVESRQRAIAEAVVELKNDFGIALGPKMGPRLLELLPQLAEVVDFSVEHDRQVVALVPHWLVGALGEIDDAQPTMTEHHRSGFLDPGPVWAAVHQGGGHGFDRGTLGSVLAQLETSDEAAHARQIPLTGTIEYRRLP